MDVVYNLASKNNRFTFSQLKDWQIAGATVRALGEMSALALLFSELFGKKIESYSCWEKLSIFFPFIFLGAALFITVFNRINEKKLWEQEKRKLERSAKFSKVMEKLNSGFSDTDKVLREEVISNSKNFTELKEIIHSIGDIVKEPRTPENQTLIADKITAALDKIVSSSGGNEGAYLAALQKFCDILAEVFDYIIAHHKNNPDSRCSVCIKPNIFEENQETEDKLKVFTLVRDKYSYNRYSKKFDKDTQRFYAENTAFEEIYIKIKKDDEKKYYYSDSLPKEIDHGYKNESLKTKGVSEAFLKGMSIEERQKYWPLKYKTTMVAPIWSSQATEEEPNLIGFLCVDCDEEDVFIETSDVPIVIGCAEGIFNLIKQFERFNN